MKVLVIDEWLPWPLDSGKKIRTYNLMVRLARRHEIHYVAYVDLPHELERLAFIESQGIRVFPVPDVRPQKWTLPFYVAVAMNSLTNKPFTTFYHIKPVFIAKLKKVIREVVPDLVHCEWTNLAPFLGHVDKGPRIISAHNLESDIWKRLAQNASNPFMRVLGRQQAARIERLEREWYPKVDHCIAVSMEDARVMRSYGAKVTVVENGVDTVYYDSHVQTQSANRATDQQSLVFVASYDVFTNQDAVDYFIQKIFPIISKKNPGVQIWLVGKEPTERIRKYAAANNRVHVTGTVSDVREYIYNAAVCVVPIRIGGGTRLKILEAMAMRKPVVSTSVGAEGLRVSDGLNILLADTAEDFAEKVRTLLCSPTMRRSIAEAGWMLVSSEYDWEALAEKQDMVWSSLLM